MCAFVIHRLATTTMNPCTNCMNKCQFCVIAIICIWSLSLVYAGPKVNELSVLHVQNSGSFRVSASLAYTGGGNISYFEIGYRLSTSDTFFQIGKVRAVSDGISGLVWTGNFEIDINDIQSPARSVQFLVFVTNQFNFKTNGTISEGNSKYNFMVT